MNESWIGSDIPFPRKSDRKNERSVVLFTHEQNIICRSHGGLSANEKEGKFAFSDNLTSLPFSVMLFFSSLVTEPSCDKDLNQIWEDGITETGYSADGETSSGSEKGISDFDDEFNQISACKGREKWSRN